MRRNTISCFIDGLGKFPWIETNAAESGYDEGKNSGFAGDGSLGRVYSFGRRRRPYESINASSVRMRTHAAAAARSNY